MASGVHLKLLQCGGSFLRQAHYGWRSVSRWNGPYCMKISTAMHVFDVQSTHLKGVLCEMDLAVDVKQNCVASKCNLSKEPLHEPHQSFPAKLPSQLELWTWFHSARQVTFSIWYPTQFWPWMRIPWNNEISKENTEELQKHRTQCLPLGFTGAMV